MTAAGRAGRVEAPRAEGVGGRVEAAGYVEEVLADMRPTLVERVLRIVETGASLPEPADLAWLLRGALPDVPAELDPHLADLGPFYASDGAMRQLRGITKQALASRRASGSVLAMRTDDGAWLYPAWQFTGDGQIHRVLRPVLKALRGVDGWVAGVWLSSDHPDLDETSPRRALREGADPADVAHAAARDMAALVA